MATWQSPSRESSVSRSSLSQRAALSRLSNPDVFSDDFALPSRDDSPDASPTDSIGSSVEDLPIRASTQSHPPRIATDIPSSHLNATNFSRPSSTSKRHLAFGDVQAMTPQRAISTVSRSDAATQRSSSISSRLSIPRAQSPYTGPTAPSQPYAMYPQVTRASSIASESTIRPVERPYLSTGGPEHPYGMYPQNTVEEEDDSLHGPALNIPLGFLGMGQNYVAHRSAGHDLGDIVGSDGHVEQLPPYTRYANNTIAKAASEDVPAPVAADDIPISPISQASDSDVNINTGAARDAGDLTTEYSEKSKTRRRLKKKVCWGVSVCVWLLVVTVIILAAILGGVIGSVIGNERGADAVADTSSPTTTTTVWLDAAPLPTGVPTPTCTPGSYNIPAMKPSLDASSCVANRSYSEAWGCVQAEPIPFWIKYVGTTPVIKLGLPGPGRIGQSFNYGAQIPDLNGSYWSLSASIDKDDPTAGGTMFFNTLFNKLTVVPASYFPINSKRSIEFADLQERTIPSMPVIPGEMPYFCWFNQTLLELFIYSNISTAARAANSTAYAYPSSTTVDSSSFSAAAATSMSAQSTSMNVNQLTSPTPEYGSLPSYTEVLSPWPTSSPWPPPPRRERRDYAYEDYPIYPKQIRLAEKRAPIGKDVPPYCVQMMVQPDYSVCEIDGTHIEIVEVEPNPPGYVRRWNRPRQATSNNNLNSDCACQWYST